MELTQWFTAEDAAGVQLLRRLSDGLRTFGDWHQPHESEWDQALQLARDACIMTEAVVQIGRAHV